MRRTTVSDSSPENLIVDLNHLAGCGETLARHTLASLLRVLGQGVDDGVAQSLCGYPMTAWLALAPAAELPRRAWAALVEEGLTEEQGMTVLAVLDDHARRRFGNRAWCEPSSIAATLASEHGLRIPGVPPATAGAPVSGSAHDAAEGLGR
jgi:hypothetical protein